MREHMTRHSNLTEYRRGSHLAVDKFGAFYTNHTDVHFKWDGADYGSRFPGHLSPAQLAEEEDRFIERRHARKPGPRRLS